MTAQLSLTHRVFRAVIRLSVKKAEQKEGKVERKEKDGDDEEEKETKKEDKEEEEESKK